MIFLMQPNVICSPIHSNSNKNRKPLDYWNMFISPCEILKLATSLLVNLSRLTGSTLSDAIVILSGVFRAFQNFSSLLLLMCPHSSNVSLASTSEWACLKKKKKNFLKIGEALNVLSLYCHSIYHVHIITSCLMHVYVVIIK